MKQKTRRRKHIRSFGRREYTKLMMFCQEIYPSFPLGQFENCSPFSVYIRQSVCKMIFRSGIHVRMCVLYMVASIQEATLYWTSIHDSC